MDKPKHIKKHTNAIRRNTELQQQLYSVIADEQERVGLALYQQKLALQKEQPYIGRTTP